MGKGLFLDENMSEGFQNPEGPYAITAASYGNKTLGVKEFVMLNMTLESLDENKPGAIECGIPMGLAEDWMVTADGQGLEPTRDGVKVWAQSGVATFLKTASEHAKGTGEDVDAAWRAAREEMDENASALVGWGFVFGEQVVKNTKKDDGGGKPKKDFKNIIVLGVVCTPEGSVGNEAATEAEGAAAGGEEGGDADEANAKLSAMIVSFLESAPAGGIAPAKMAEKVKAEFTNDQGEEWGEWAAGLVESDDYYADPSHPWKVVSGKLVMPKKAAPAPAKAAPPAPKAPIKTPAPVVPAAKPGAAKKK